MRIYNKYLCILFQVLGTFLSVGVYWFYNNPQNNFYNAEIIKVMIVILIFLIINLFFSYVLYKNFFYTITDKYIEKKSLLKKEKNYWSDLNNIEKKTFMNFQYIKIVFEEKKLIIPLVCIEKDKLLSFIKKWM